MLVAVPFRPLARANLQSLLFSLVLIVPASCQDFRMETEVYENGAEPVSESLTLFAGDVVYDFLLTPTEETAILDIQRGKLVLLDAKRGLKTTFTTGQLAEFSAAILSKGTEKGPNGLFQPKFETVYDAEQRRVTLTSDWLTYKAKGVDAKYDEGAQRYRQFADWNARLNAMRPGNMPPFGRLALNQVLAEHGLLPQEIERTVILDRPVTNKTLHAKSKHAINWILSNTDRGRIEKAGRDLVNFKEVPPGSYWSVPEQTARK